MNLNHARSAAHPGAPHPPISQGARAASWRPWAAWGLFAIMLIVLHVGMGPAKGGGESLANGIEATVALHLVAAGVALALTAVLAVMRKGTPHHRLLGRIWAGAMLTLAIGAFWIRHDGGLSWLHGFSVLTLVSLPYALFAIRRGNRHGHRHAMTGLSLGLSGAALGALAPGRLISTWWLGL